MSKVLKKTMKFPHTLFLSSRYKKSHAHAFLSVRLQLSVFCAHSQKSNNIIDREDERRSGTPGRLRVISFFSAGDERRVPAFVLSFFFRKFSLSLSCVCPPLYPTTNNYSERKVDHELEINDDVAQTGKRRRRRRQRPREEEHR